MSAFRVFLAPGLTLTYHRLKSAKTPERERWRRAGCAPRAQRQLHSQRSVRGAPLHSQLAAATDVHRTIEESARKPNGPSSPIQDPASSTPRGWRYLGGTPHSTRTARVCRSSPVHPSNTSSRTLWGQTRYRRFGPRLKDLPWSVRSDLTSQNRFQIGYPPDQE